MTSFQAGSRQKTFEKQGSFDSHRRAGVTFLLHRNQADLSRIIALREEYRSMPEPDVCGTTRKMVELFGPVAHQIAMNRADRQMDAGDVRGFSRWQEISQAIRCLQDRGRLGVQCPADTCSATYAFGGAKILEIFRCTSRIP